MGGLTCFGAVEREENEPVFHGDWERRVFAVTVASGGTFGSVDKRRHASERLDPAQYLQSSYYEQWLARLELLAKEAGLVTDEELASGVAGASDDPLLPPLDPQAMTSIVKQGRPATRESGRLEPRFSVGDRVRARNLNPPGHTRLTRYARGRAGVIHRLHGTHYFPDSTVRGEGEDPQPLYSVCFRARELWGPDAAAQDHLFIDLWEDYLEADDG